MNLDGKGFHDDHLQCVKQRPKIDLGKNCRKSDHAMGHSGIPTGKSPTLQDEKHLKATHQSSSENLPKIMDKNFTALMEEDLDKIAAGDMDRDTLLNEFYATFPQLVPFSDHKMSFNLDFKSSLEPAKEKIILEDFKKEIEDKKLILDDYCVRILELKRQEKSAIENVIRNKKLVGEIHKNNIMIKKKQIIMKNLEAKSKIK